MLVHLALLDLAATGDQDVGPAYLTAPRSEVRKNLLLGAVPRMGARLFAVAQLHRGVKASPSEKAYATVLEVVLEVLNGQFTDAEKRITTNQPHIGARGRIAWVNTLTAWQRQRPVGDRAGRAAPERLKERVVTCP